MTKTEKRQLDTIATLLKEAGYDPYTQIYGYYITGEDSYITRTGDAREKIKLLGTDVIREFLDQLDLSRKNSL